MEVMNTQYMTERQLWTSVNDVLYTINHMLILKVAKLDWRILAIALWFLAHPRRRLIGPDLKLFILVGWDRSFRLLLGPPGLN